MQNIPWQAREVLAVFDRLNRRPGDALPVEVLWRNVLRGNAVVDAGYAELNRDETAVTLTEGGTG
jgi:hypothetical protein